MPFTVVASWDFRGSDSAATKRASRIGAFTFTERGSLTYDTNGVTISGANVGLYVDTIPAGLRLSQPFWTMVAYRRLGAVGTNANVCGWLHNSTDADPYVSLNVAYAGGAVLLVQANNAGTFVSANTGFSPVVNTDYAITVQKNSTNAEVFNGSTSLGSVTAAGQPTYGTTAQFALGNGTGISPDVNQRVAWVLVGTGDITTGEMATIQADPNTYIYGGGGGPTPAFRPYFITG